jgi:iron-sulfur cluster repair protein YtfE (RIC family)
MDTHIPHHRMTAYGQQLIEVHDHLRDELADLIDNFDGPHPRDLRAHCLTFCSAVERHHTEEDAGVFPALARQFPELRPVLDGLRRDHSAVSAMLRAIESLTRAALDPADVPRVRREIEGIAALLESHFRWEERRLVTALDSLQTPIQLSGPEAGPAGPEVSPGSGG